MADRVIRFKGDFDASQILASLKQIRSEMEKGGVDSSLFKNVDKDISKTEALITKMMGKLQSGFRDTKEVIAFEKQIGQVATNLNQIGVGLKRANFPENFGKAAEKIEDLSINLKVSQQNLEKAKQSALAFVDAQRESGRYTKAQANEIKNAADNEEELLKVVKKVNEEQSKKAQASITKSLTSTKNGPISDSTKANMGTAITGGLSSEATLNLAGANIGIKSLEAYKEMMRQVILEGKSLSEAFNNLQSEFDQNDKEILESEKFIEAYTQDLKTLALTAADAGKAEGYNISKGNISRQANTISAMGSSTVSGEFVPNTSGYDATIAKIQTLETEILQLKNEIYTLQNTVDSSVTITNGKIDEANVAINNNATAWRNSGEATREAVVAAENFDNTFNNLQNIAKQVLSLTSAWRMFRQQVVNTYNDVKELDKSFAKIAMVTNYQVSDLWEQYENYADMANRLGQSTQSVVEASGLFYQQGLDTAEALALTEDTMKLATLAGLDFSEATSQMTAALRAFHMEMDEGSHITDVYAELAAHAAADVQGIAYAMSKTASIANSAGMAFETTSAFLTQMIETTQEAPENIGTAMKTIIARFTELKENVAGTADSEFDDLDYNKVDKALKTVGISIKDATGQFRNLDEVFLELSKKWDTLDRNSQRYIATIAAGSRQQSRFIAMMENYDRTIELVNTAYNSAGKSSEQFAKFSDSVEFKVNKLKNTWEQFRINLLSSEGYKSLLDTLTQIVSKFEGIDLKKLLVLTPMFLVLGRTLAKSWIQGLSDGLSKGSGLIDKAIGKLSSNGKSSIEIKADITKAKAKIEELKQEKAQLAADKKGIEIVSQKTQQNLTEAEDKLKQLNQQAEDLFNQPSENLEENFDNITEKINSTKTKVKELKNELNNLESREAETSSKQAQNETDLNVAVAGKKEISKGYNLKAIGSGVGTALGQSMATAAMMAFSGGFDLSDIAKTTAVQSGISAFTSLISGNWQMALGQAAIAGISLGIDYINKKITEENEKLRIQQNKVYAINKEIDNLEKIQEDFNEQLDKANKEYDEQKEHWDKVSDAAEIYKDLKSRVALTTEQEEQLQEAQNTLIEECPELVTRYGQVGDAIIDLGNNFDTVIEKQRQLYEEAALEQSKAEIASGLLSSVTADAKVDKAKEELKQIRDVYEGYYAATSDGNGTYYQYDESDQAYNFLREGLWNIIDIEEQFGTDEEKVKQLKKARKALKNFYEETGDYAEAIKKFEEKYSDISQMVGLKSGESILKLETFDEATGFFYDSTNFSEAEDYLRTMLKQNEKAAQIFIEVIKDATKENSELKEAIVAEFGSIESLKTDDTDKLVEIFDSAGEDTDEELWKDFSSRLLNSDYLKQAQDEVEKAQSRAEAAAKDEADKLNDIITDNFKIQIERDKDIEIDEDLAPYLYQGLEEAFANSPEIQKSLNNIKEQVREDVSQAYINGDNEAIEEAIESAEIDIKNLLNSNLENFYNDDKIQNIISAYQNLKENYKKQIVSFYGDLGKVSLEESQKVINDLQNDGLAPEIANTMQNSLDTLVTQTANYKKQLADIMGLKFGTSENGAGLAYGKTKINPEEFFNSTQISSTLEQILPEYQHIFVQAITDMAGEATSDEEKRLIVNRFNDFLKNTSKEIDPLAFGYNFDWKNLNLLNLEEQQEAFFDYYQNTLHRSLEEAKQAWQSYFNFISTNTDLIDLTIDEIAVQEMADSVSEKFSNILSKFSGVKDIIQKQLTDGFINFSESQQLKEACEEIGLKAEDYLQYNADGTINFNAEQFKNDTKDQITNEEEIVNQLRAQVDQQIEQLELQIAIIKGDQDKINLLNKQTKSQQNFNNQLKSTAELMSAMGLVDGNNLKNLDLKYDTSNYDVDASSTTLDTLQDKLDYYINYKDQLQVGSDLIKPLIDQTNAAATELDMTWDEIVEATKQSTEELEKAVDDAASKVKDATEKVTSALEDVKKAEQDVIDKTNELNEKLYGTEDYKNKSEGLYNYTAQLERLAKAADDAKSALDNLQGEDAEENLNKYLDKSHQEIVSRKAENQVIQQSINNYQDVLNSRLGQAIADMNSKYGSNMDVNASDFYYRNGDRWAINFAALNAANIPDEISDYVEETVEQMNKLEDSIESNSEAIKKREKEIRDIRKKGLEAEVNLEQKVADVLKEKYQEEVDDLKDKYDAMKDADDKYLDALEDSINKQRELRSRQNEWENLATKEKKLSLMQRDTSGANKVATQKLQKEIQSDREKLLDNSIDNIVKNLKELYATQQETREVEIEYQENLLENSDFIKEANVLISSWTSADDAIQFFYENVKNISKMSEAQLEQEEESWKEMYEAHTLYTVTNTKNFKNMLDKFESDAIATNDEIQQVIKKTSETLTTEANRSLNEITTKASESIENAKKAVEDALQTLADKQKAYNEAVQAQAEAVAALSTAQNALTDARKLYDEAVLELEKDKLSEAILSGLIAGLSTNPAVTVPTIGLAGLGSGVTQHGVKEKQTGEITKRTNSYDEAASWIERNIIPSERGKYSAFKTGGLVNYTGPAWVDGTPNKPEAFLNSTDTERIGQAAELLASISDFLNFNRTSTDSIVNNNSISGDTIVNVVVNVDSISDDYDVDSAIERVKEDIVQAANFAGANVILRQ